MRMRLVAGALSVALLPAALTACGTAQPAEIDTHFVDLATLPAELPEPVAKLGARAVQLTVYDGRKPQLQASGVILNRRDILTVGHAMHNPAAADKKPYACSAYAVRNPKFGAPAIKAIGDHRSIDGKPLDASLLRLPDSQQLADWYQPQPIRDEPIQPGEHIYFVTYQPRVVKNKQGDSELQPREPGAKGNRSKPAIYGGVVLGSRYDGTVDVATGLKTYVKAGDDASRPGASGGGAYDGNGELLGAVTGTIDASTFGIVAPLKYGVFVNSEFATTPFQGTRVQLTPRAMIRAMRQRIAKAPECTAG